MSRIIAMTVIPAALVSGLIMLIAWRPWRSAAAIKRAEWGGPLALGVGFGVSYFATSVAFNETMPQWMPRERWQWVIVMALAATCFGLICSVWRPRGWEMIFLCAVTSFCMGWLLQPTSIVAHRVAHQVIAGSIVFVLTLSLEHLVRKRSSQVVTVSMVIVFAGAATLFLQSGFARLSLLAACVSAALVSVMLLIRCCRGASLQDGGMLWLGALLPVLLAIGSDTGYNTGEVPWTSFALIASAPLMLWLKETKWFKRMRAERAFIGCIVLLSLPVIIALAITWPIRLPPI